MWIRIRIRIRNTDLKRIRLSCGRMIRLLSPFPVSNLSFFISLSVCRRSSLLAEEWGGEGVGEEQNHTTARKPGPLYKSFTTLCIR
jgi:hypothetical protein